jgi:hypothetical protein
MDIRETISRKDMNGYTGIVISMNTNIDKQNREAWMHRMDYHG